MRCGACPVSYTHLDVYKRQGVKRDILREISVVGRVIMRGILKERDF